jgi:hypothetical protein
MRPFLRSSLRLGPARTSFCHAFPLIAAFAALGSASCSSDKASADGDTFGRGQQGGGAGGQGGSVNPGDPGDTDFIQLPPTPGGSGVSPSVSGVPNFGTETVCDGIDNDGNGVIDDVDVGKDGLCDCIQIGFFGEVASDAGNATGSFEAWLVARSGQIPIQHLDATDKLTSAWLAPLQVLIVGGLKGRAAQGKGQAFAADEIAAFDDWVQTHGGGVITLSGYTSNIDDAYPVSELLQHTGLSYDLMSVTGAGVVSEGAPPVWLQDITAPDHPIVAGVAEIGVYYGYPVEGDGTGILSGAGHVLGMAKQWGTGRVFAFADEWITQDATWQGLANGQQNPCQQPCNEQENICRVAAQQCEQCAEQPCSDPNETDLTTCEKGCQPSCDSETARCNTNKQLCETCSAGVTARAEATPRLWLNTIRWLTPDNECKVAIPPPGGIRVVL